MLHLEDRILAEVHEALHLLLVPAVADGCVEERFLGFLYLWFLPLVQLVFVDLEVNSFNLVIVEYVYVLSKLLSSKDF